MAGPIRDPKDRTDDLALWRKFVREGDRATRDQLIQRYLHLVKYVIHRLIAKSSTDHEVVSFDDLYTAGVTGLINAVDNFDPERGVKFVTYAVPRIRGAVIDELRAVDWFPRALRQRVNELYRAFRDLEGEHGRAPTEDELAERLQADPQELALLLQAASRSAVLSLDEEFGLADERGRSGETLTVDTSAPCPRDSVQRQQAVLLVEEAVSALPEKERLVVTLYFFRDLTLKEIGAALGVTESRACQILGSATLRLRARLAALHTDLASLY